jgi:hypothetical protein
LADLWHRIAPGIITLVLIESKWNEKWDVSWWRILDKKRAELARGHALPRSRVVVETALLYYADSTLKGVVRHRSPAEAGAAICFAKFCGLATCLRKAPAWRAGQSRPWFHLHRRRLPLASQEVADISLKGKLSCLPAFNSNQQGSSHSVIDAV